MAVNCGNRIDIVVFLGCHSDNSLSAAVLRGIGIGRQTLDIARLCKRNNAIMLFPTFTQALLFVSLIYARFLNAMKHTALTAIKIG